MAAREVAVVPAHVVELAADHPEGRAGQLVCDGRRRIRERELEGLGEQGVTVEDRRRLVELDVRGRPPAAEVVVVERGQVVVDHAERVHELDRRGRGQQLLRARPDGLPGREAEHRPDPLAAAVEAVAHRLRQRA